MSVSSFEFHLSDFIRRSVVMVDIWKHADRVLGTELKRALRNGTLADEWRTALGRDFTHASRKTVPKLTVPMLSDHQISFFPTIDAIARINTVGPIFPEICCVCGSPATREFPLPPLTLRERALARLGIWPSMLVPHCAAHGGPHAALLQTVRYHNEPCAFFYAIGLSRAFLDGIVTLNVSGEMYPPWVAFPYGHPEFGWNQGLHEPWKADAWLPYWRRLPDEDRHAYLKRWKAGEAWSDVLLHDPRWGGRPKAASA